MINLFKVELRRTWSLFIAYPSEEFIGILIYAVFFYLLFRDNKYNAKGGILISRLDGMVVAYVLWFLIALMMQGLASDLQAEKTQGTLEQMMTSVFGPTRIFLTRSIANLTVAVLEIAAMGALIVFLTGTSLHLSPLMIVPFVTTTMAAVGLGFAFGSLVFVLQRVGSLVGAFQFPLLAVIAVPIETWSKVAIFLSTLVPLAPSAAAMRVLLVNQRFDPLLVVLGLINGLIYLAGGIALFRHMECRAKKRGNLGQF